MSLLGQSYGGGGVFGLPTQTRFGSRQPQTNLVPSASGSQRELPDDQKAFTMTKQRTTGRQKRVQAFDQVRGTGFANLDGYQLFVGGSILLFIAFVFMRSK